MKAPLRLVPTPHPAHDTAGWLVPGCDAAAWLRAIAHTGVPLSGAELRLVPRSRRDRTPIAALLTGPGLDARPTPHAQPYGLVAARLFVPTNARLLPAVTDAELAGLLATPSALMHPTVGLVGFEGGDVLRATDLLTLQGAGPSGWAMPEPGPAVVARLLSVEPLEPMTLAGLEEQLGEGLGDKPLGELPLTDDERDPGALGKAGKGLTAGLAGAVGWLTDKAPQNADKRTWVDAVGDWADARRNNPQRADQEQRNREVNRLIDMLSKKSAEALSYAIPLSGLSQARGVGSAGNRLTKRGTGFSLSGMFGGGPADPWDIAAQQQDALRKAYRAMAVSEAEAGRYRRSAYIYGTLLGDAEAAARVLEEGGYYHEAAVIYREKLRRPTDAARCLERGGLLSEAAVIYLEQQQWLNAAAIYDRLERPDEARRWYRRAAEHQAGARQYRTAAKLYEDKLAEPDEAQRLLLLGVHAETPDLQCLEDLFAFTARQGRHGVARETVASLSASVTVPGVAGYLAQACARGHAGYPEPETRHALAEAAYQLAGRHLPGLDPPRLAPHFTEALRTLAPGDRLLYRDTQRYTERAIAARKTKRTPPRSQTSRPADGPAPIVSLTKDNSLPDGHWHELYAVGETLVAVGEPSGEREGLVAAVELGETKWRWTKIGDPYWDHPGHYARVVATTLRHRHGLKSELAVDIRDRPAVRPTELLSRREGGPDISVSTPGVLPDTALALCGHTPRLLWALVGTLADLPELVLNAYNDQDALIQSIPVSLLPEAIQTLIDSDAPPVARLHARGELTVLSLGRVLLRFAGGAQVGEEILPRPVIHIAGAAPFARSRFALTHPRGLTMMWHHPGSHETVYACSEIDDPAVCFTNNAGLLIAAGRDGCRLYRTSGGSLRALGHTAWPDGKAMTPAALAPLGRGDDFAVLMTDGRVLRFHTKPPATGRY